MLANDGHGFTGQETDAADDGAVIALEPVAVKFDEKVDDGADVSHGGGAFRMSGLADCRPGFRGFGKG